LEDERFVATVTVPSRIDSIRVATSFLVQTARSFGVPASDNTPFEVAIVEALNNALTHGSQDRDNLIICELELAGRCLKIRVMDQAAKFETELNF